jgi:ABC-2 type transport system permease protein
MAAAPPLSPTSPLRTPAISRAGAFWALYALTLRQHLHGRRWLVTALLFLLPFGLAVLLRFIAPNVPPQGLEFILVMMFVPQALLPIVALLYASGILQDEQEDQTITYLLLRPIPKWVLYGLKLLAAMTATVVLVVFFLGLTYAAIYVGGPLSAHEVAVRWLKAAAICSLAEITYCSLFGLLSLLTSRILVVGILYIAIVEGLLANFPFSIRLVTVIYYARIIAYRTMSFQVPGFRGGSEDMAATAWQLNPNADFGLTLHPQLVTCIAILLGASVVFAAIAAWLASQREFHVKTPEKD